MPISMGIMILGGVYRCLTVLWYYWKQAQWVLGIQTTGSSLFLLALIFFVGGFFVEGSDEYTLKEEPLHFLVFHGSWLALFFYTWPIWYELSAGESVKEFFIVFAVFVGVQYLCWAIPYDYKYIKACLKKRKH